MTVYGLALAPLGVGALSLPVRRAWARRPLRFAQRELGEACAAWGWTAPRRRAQRVLAEGTVRGSRVEVAIGPDPRHGDPAGTIQTVWIRVRVDVSAFGVGNTSVLIEPHRGATVRGSAAWGAVWLGLGFERFARPNDQLEIRAGALRFDRFSPSFRRGSLRPLVDDVVRAAHRVGAHRDRLEEHLRALALEHPSGSVRARSLRALASVPTGYEAARAAAHRALEDPDPRARLHAAALLGRDGEATLWALITAEEDEDLQLRALEHLADLDSPRLDGASRRLSRHPSLRVAAEAMRHAGADALSHLVDDLDAPGEHRAAGLEVLERRDATRARSLARRYLSHGPPVLRIACVDVLGRGGDATDFAAIRRGGAAAPTGSELFIASRAALDLIRDRTRAECGRISLLSGPKEAIGAVSLPG